MCRLSERFIFVFYFTAPEDCSNMTSLITSLVTVRSTTIFSYVSRTQNTDTQLVSFVLQTHSHLLYQILSPSFADGRDSASAA